MLQVHVQRLRNKNIGSRVELGQRSHAIASSFFYN